jgi:hypothetical protein
MTRWLLLVVLALSVPAHAVSPVRQACLAQCAKPVRPATAMERKRGHYHRLLVNWRRQVRACVHLGGPDVVPPKGVGAICPLVGPDVTTTTSTTTTTSVTAVRLWDQFCRYDDPVIHQRCCCDPTTAYHCGAPCIPPPIP